MDKYLSEKIRVLSYILIVFVVFLHSYNLPKSTIFILSLNSFIQNFISNGITRIAVPLYFLISGYLFFITLPSNLFDFSQKWKKRARTLVIPYLFWSIFGLLLYFILQIFPLFQSFFTHKLIRNYTYNDLFETIFLNPIPYQLWFIRDLIVLVILAPIINYLFKRLSYLFLIILFSIWVLFPSIYLIASESILFFSLGLFFAIKFQELLSFKISNKLFYALLITYLFLLSVNTLLLVNFNYISLYFVLHKMILLLGILTLWFSYDILYAKSHKTISHLMPVTSFTFFIFAAHEPILTILKKTLLFQLKQIPDNSLITFLIAPLFTITICYFIAYVIKTIIPNFYFFITGSR